MVKKNESNVEESRDSSTLMEDHESSDPVQHAEPQGQIPATKVKTTVFDGKLAPGAIRRTYRLPDPATPGKMITVPKRFDFLYHLVVDRVSGHGKSKGLTGERYIALSGQYGQFATARITVSLQNADTLKKYLLDKGLLDTANKSADGQTIPLKEDILVSAAGTQMRGQGWVVEELFRHHPDGTREVIIGQPDTTDMGGPVSIEEAFL